MNGTSKKHGPLQGFLFRVRGRRNMMKLLGRFRSTRIISSIGNSLPRSMILRKGTEEERTNERASDRREYAQFHPGDPFLVGRRHHLQAPASPPCSSSRSSAASVGNSLVDVIERGVSLFASRTFSVRVFINGSAQIAQMGWQGRNDRHHPRFVVQFHSTRI